ncbi:O-acetyl-ADP-ribose deacetylase MACROD2 [Folsomia candida]|uniref:O-acetyl-ADP-ribose deacetylase MACROD2 n=1 Tax=Folsomia candida TaxID=158441 RepID=A0A226DAW2_FOLCA|nr:O-acetyl-ADP-ribose deacetylase MACROD2 [Folsomia candida]
MSRRVEMGGWAASVATPTRGAQKDASRTISHLDVDRVLHEMLRWEMAGGELVKVARILENIMTIGFSQMMSVKKLCSWARGKMRWSYSQATDSCSQRTFHSSSHRATVKVYDESWRPVKEKYLHMDIDEKRQQYFVKGNYLDLDRIRPWPVYFEHMRIPPTSQKRKYPLKFPVNYRVTMGQGNIVAVELDAIVNPTSLDMMGTGGECDKIVHLAAGKELMLECKTLRGCDIGEAKITGGYRLPAKYVIHTVGPVGHHPTVDSLLRKLSQPDAPEQFEDDRMSLNLVTRILKLLSARENSHEIVDILRHFLAFLHKPMASLPNRLLTLRWIAFENSWTDIPTMWTECALQFIGQRI